MWKRKTSSAFSLIDALTIVFIFVKRSGISFLRYVLSTVDFRHMSLVQDLDDLIERRMQGSLKKILHSLLLSPYELDCHEIRRVCTTADSNDNTLVEIFLSNSSQYLRHMNETFLRRKSLRAASS